MQHKNIPSTEAHEPKGIEGASTDTVYVAQGNGSGSWQPNNQGAMVWNGYYQNDTEYLKNAVVRDGLWTMIANKTTSHKPAPILDGTPAVGFTVQPTFVEGSDSGIIQVGHTYTFTKAGLIQKILVRVSDVGNFITHELILRNMTKDTEVTIPLPTLTADTWVEIDVGYIRAVTGDVLRVYVEVEDTAQVPSAVAYPEDAVYFTTHSIDFATTTGYKNINGSPSSVDDSAFGVDLSFQDAVLSPDWDIVAHSA